MFTVGELEITYLTNCAVLVQWGETKLLVDGIFSGRQPFDIMDEDIEEKILTGKGDYAGIEYILVTHCHNDHYNGSKILRFLENHVGAKALIPVNGKLNEETLATLEAKVIRMDEDVEVMRRISFGDLTIEYMRSEHLTYKYPQHYCINIVTPTTNVLLTADMDLARLGCLPRFTKRENSAVFVNQIVLWHKKWIRQLMDMAYSEVFFYHLPSRERDLLGYRKRALIYWEKHNMLFSNGILLGYEENQMIGCKSVNKSLLQGQ